MCVVTTIEGSATVNERKGEVSGIEKRGVHRLIIYLALRVKVGGHPHYIHMHCVTPEVCVLWTLERKKMARLFYFFLFDQVSFSLFYFL